ncbi:MAG: S-layer homology domain-containing protein [Acidimicrobiia bacterium]|nr:S-layer homology domain-containing protein [Acidimicrobiia bacterium]
MSLRPGSMLVNRSVTTSPRHQPVRSGRGRRRALVAVAALLAALVPVSGVSADGSPSTTRVSVASDGTEANDRAFSPSISADGRWAAFSSPATNLVPDDTNDVSDVFVHDLHSGSTERISVASDGSEGDATSAGSSLSADGRYVAFTSFATNLVPDVTNDVQDVYVRDRVAGTTERVSVASTGAEADGVSTAATISANGRFVTFASDATNLVPDDTNDARDVFVHDRMTGDTERVSVATDGAEANGTSTRPSLSANGRYVTFDSEATNLVPGDTNDARDVFVHDRSTGTTERVSLAHDGSEADDTSSNASISPSGRHIAFSSPATNLVPGDTNDEWDVFVHDRKDGSIERVSVATDGTEANGGSGGASIGAGGRHVSFHTTATNLAPGTTGEDNHVLVRDRRDATTEVVSVALGGSGGNSASQASSLTPRGRFVTFLSFASDLVAGDTNDTWDSFVRDRGPQCVTGFGDVAPLHQFCAEIEWMVAEGITTGFDDDTFRPTAQLSRMAMAAFLYRAAGEPAVTLPAEPTFDDVDAAHPFRTEIEWMVAEGITTGFDDDTFRPTAPLSRMAMAAFLHRSMGEPAVTVPSPVTFADVDDAHPFVVPIEWMVFEGITTGFDDDTFRPANPLSRQAMAAFLERADDVVL